MDAARYVIQTIERPVTGFITSASVDNTFAGATLTVTIPSLVHIGDFMVLAVNSLQSSASNPTDPSGWTFLDTVTGTGSTFNTRLRVWTRVAISGDVGGSTTVSTSTVHGGQFALLAYRGFSTVNTHNIQNSGNVNVITAPAVTTSATSTIVISVFGRSGGSDAILTPPPTTRINISSASSGDLSDMAISEFSQPTAATTTAQTCSSSNFGSSAGMTIALH